jgi:pimeloyl-ACP methyl ester carboxylesterase
VDPGLLAETAPLALVDEVVAMMAEFHLAGYRAMALSLAEADLRDVLRRSTIPTLLLYGDADRRAPLSVAGDLHDRIPGSILVVLPGAGHLANLDASERFDTEVRSFLRRAA